MIVLVLFLVFYFWLLTLMCFRWYCRLNYFVLFVDAVSDVFRISDEQKARSSSMRQVYLRGEEVFDGSRYKNEESKRMSRKL